MKSSVVFEPSNVHQGHYVIINGESSGIILNLYAYKTIERYKNEVDNKIKEYIKNETKTQKVFNRNCDSDYLHINKRFRPNFNV